MGAYTRGQVDLPIEVQLSVVRDVCYTALQSRTSKFYDKARARCIPYFKTWYMNGKMVYVSIYGIYTLYGMKLFYETFFNSLCQLVLEIRF